MENTELLLPTGNATAQIALTFRFPSNIKFISVEVAMDFEDLAKAPYERTFQTFFQLPIATRQTQNNPYAGAIEDLTTFGRPNDLSLLSVDDFATMIF